MTREDREKDIEQEAERRRYALLQAAAILHRDAMEMAARLDLPIEDLAPTLPQSSVDIAEKLLAEIEKREKEGH